MVHLQSCYAPTNKEIGTVAYRIFKHPKRLQSLGARAIENNIEYIQNELRFIFIGYFTYNLKSSAALPGGHFQRLHDQNLYHVPEIIMETCDLYDT